MDHLVRRATLALFSVDLEPQLHGLRVFDFVLGDEARDRAEPGASEGEGAVMAADSFERDAILFERVLDGMRFGNTNMDIAKLDA